jgi:hypothetical protein
MGLFWDLMQQSQLSEQSKRSSSLESRVVDLERELRDTRQLLHTLIERLETHLGHDVDGDGRIG